MSWLALPGDRLALACVNWMRIYMVNLVVTGQLSTTTGVHKSLAHTMKIWFVNTNWFVNTISAINAAGMIHSKLGSDITGQSAVAVAKAGCALSQILRCTNTLRLTGPMEVVSARGNRRIHCICTSVTSHGTSTWLVMAMVVQNMITVPTECTGYQISHGPKGDWICGGVRIQYWTYPNVGWFTQRTRCNWGWFTQVS